MKVILPFSGTVRYISEARERALIELLLEGFSNKEIAHKMALTEGTVKLYISTVFRRHGYSTRVELIAAKLWAKIRTLEQENAQLRARVA